MLSAWPGLWKSPRGASTRMGNPCQEEGPVSCRFRVEAGPKRLCLQTTPGQGRGWMARCCQGRRSCYGVWVGRPGLLLCGLPNLCCCLEESARTKFVLYFLFSRCQPDPTLGPWCPTEQRGVGCLPWPIASHGGTTIGGAGSCIDAPQALPRTLSSKFPRLKIQPLLGLYSNLICASIGDSHPSGSQHCSGSPPPRPGTLDKARSAGASAGGQVPGPES